jgi:hypothetical protein
MIVIILFSMVIIVPQVSDLYSTSQALKEFGQSYVVSHEQHIILCITGDMTWKQIEILCDEFFNINYKQRFNMIILCNSSNQHRLSILHEINLKIYSHRVTFILGTKQVEANIQNR